MEGGSIIYNYCTQNRAAFHQEAFAGSLFSSESTGSQEAREPPWNFSVKQGIGCSTWIKAVHYLTEWERIQRQKKYSPALRPHISFLFASSLEKEIKRHLCWVSRSGGRSLTGPGPMLFDLRSPWKWALGFNGLISSAFARCRATPLPAIWWGMCWFLPTCFSFYPADKELLAQTKPISPFTPVCSISSAFGLSRHARQTGFVLWRQLGSQSQQKAGHSLAGGRRAEWDPQLQAAASSAQGHGSPAGQGDTAVSVPTALH